MKKLLLYGVVGLFVFSACSGDDNNNVVEPIPSSDFTVTIENIQEDKAFFMNGTSTIAMPGNTISYTFHAGKGAYLSFAAMLVQSNDLFYGFEDSGLALYDTNGNAVTGDVTSQVKLWDAGTEVNQEPGTGTDQAARQSGMNVGNEENSTVKEITDVNDGFSYPATSEVLEFRLTHDGNTQFTATIRNVSNANSFQTAIAPGVFAIHYSGQPIFIENQAAANGLEALAEDGEVDMLATYLSNNSGYVTSFAPGVYVIYGNGFPLFESGQFESGNGLEALAEDSNPNGLNSYLNGVGNLSHGVFSTPVGASSPAPLMPDESYQFSFTANENDKLNFVTMLVESNDLFLAFDDSGMALFSNGQPISGDITSQLKLWDAGTEMNEYPGAGNNQAPRQAAENTGSTEGMRVNEVSDGFTYPSIENMIRVTITAN